MKLHLSRNRSSDRHSLATSIVISAVALLAVLGLSSCDSHDTAATTGAGSPAAPVPAGTPAVLSQEELASTFATLPTLVAEAKTDTIFKQFRAQQQATLAASDNRLVVTATGDDPQLILPAFAAGKTMIIEAIIDTQADTFAQMFYMTNGQSDYGDGQSQSVPLKTGRNVVYFRIDAPNLIDPIRFDPAAAPGTYTIESMTARGPVPPR